MARASDPAGSARQFASSLQRLLNRTICNGATVVARGDANENNLLVVGTRLDDQLLAHPVGATTSGRKPTAWLDAEYRCLLGEDGSLSVVTSYCAVYAADGETRLCHYDFEREKDRYATAHLQVSGSSPALDLMPGVRRSQDLHKLHFPVGGRRYRPCLEDIIEFMIAERFAEPRNDWQRVLDAERRVFLTRQLRAAVRGDPQTARAALGELDRDARSGQSAVIIEPTSRSSG